MKRIGIALLFTFFVGTVSKAQETDPLLKTEPTSVQSEISKAEKKEQKKVEKETKKKEKEAKKTEKAKKQAEKEIKRREQYEKIITKRKKNIAKWEREIAGIENKISKKKVKGKLLPIDEMEMNQKIHKLRLNILREKDKVSKLEKRQ